MKVKRIVPNIAATDLSLAEAFYGNIFELNQIMDLGWIQTYANTNETANQISFVQAPQTTQPEQNQTTDNIPAPDLPFPSLTIEVDDLEEIVARLADAKIKIEYGPVIEPWGVNRLFVADPFGKIINVMQHAK